jgi:hypothetical protein
MLTVAPVGPRPRLPVRSRDYQWVIAFDQNQRPKTASPIREDIELAGLVIAHGAALLAPVPPAAIRQVRGQAGNSTYRQDLAADPL